MAKQTDKNTEQLPSFDKGTIDALLQIKDYKLACEANIVSIFYKKPDLIYDCDLTVEDFSDNMWRVFFTIADEIIKKEKKNSLDDVTVGLYLEKHKKLRAKYDEYGGYDTITRAKEFINESNLSGYIDELHKWKAILLLAKRGFPIKDKIKEFVDMNLDEIYAEYDAQLNHIFINANGDVKSHDICDGLDELIDELDKGMAVGLPYYDMIMLNKETGGMLLGNITLLGGLSNVGKTSISRIMTLPSFIKYNEQVVIMLNEESYTKWQRELLVYVANNILKYDLQKYVVRDGGFSEETKSILLQAAEWIKNKTNNHLITFIPFKSYNTSRAIKVIKKYAAMGVKYFILDTFKADADTSTNSDSWFAMQQAMVAINDVVKPESKNVHILITFQLAKSSARQRYYTQDNIGIAKNIADVASTGLMIRDIFPDEYTGEKNALKVYRLDGKNGRSKIPVDLDKSKRYQLLFIVKNREGGANQYQIVLESDLSRNIVREIGITSVPVDF